MAIVAIALAFGLHGPVSAAVPPNVLDAAKREGAVVFYTSLTAGPLNGVVRLFEQSHPGIKVQTLRLTSNVMLPRIVTEQRGGTYNVDVVNTGALSLVQLALAGALQPYRPADPGKFSAGAIDPRGEWVTFYSNGTVIAWNPQKLAADGLKPPKSIEDLTKTQWRGKIGLDSLAVEFYQGLVETQSAAVARRLIMGIMANRPLLTQGHSNTLSRLEAGEFDVTPTVYDSTADHDRRAGLPVDFVNPKPLFLDRSPIALAKNAPHPNAARVLMDWLLSKDGQSAMVELGGNISARTDVDNIPTILAPKTPFHVLRALNPTEYNALVKQYNELLGLPN
jgi:iron(III) transport system substrate-binding protein